MTPLAVTAATTIRRVADDPDDDRHWIAGLIYFNPQDRRLLVPKKFGLGLGRTFNLAHPASWVILVLIVLVASLAARH